jgi:transcriptional regulator with XRE-family HTH domain
MDYEEALGIAIVERRLSMDISQVDFARLSRLHRNVVSAVERGDAPVDDVTLGNLALALRCPVSHLKAAAQRILEGHRQDNK